MDFQISLSQAQLTEINLRNKVTIEALVDDYCFQMFKLTGTPVEKARERIDSIIREKWIQMGEHFESQP